MIISQMSKIVTKQRHINHITNLEVETHLFSPDILILWILFICDEKKFSLR